MNNRKRIPKVRFNGFSGEWIKLGLLDTIERIIDFRGRTPKKLGLDWSPLGYRALSALNVKQGYIDFSIDPHFGDQELYDKWMKGSELHKGQVLFTTEAPMGNVAQIPNSDKYILSQRTIAFVVQTEVITENYLAVLLTSPNVFSELTALASGGTAKGVSQKVLANLSVFIPNNLLEQTAIGNFFQKIDNLLQQHQQKHDKLLNLRKAMLEKIFPKQGETTPEIRFKGFSGDWEKVQLGEIGEFNRGQFLGWKHISDNASNPCILYGHLYTTYGMTIDKIFHFTNENKYTIPRSKKGDILIPGSDTTPTGIARATCINLDDVLLGGDINILRPNNNVDGKFLSYYINNNRDKLIKIIKGTSVKHLISSDLMLITVMLPSSVHEQKKIGNYFQKLDTLINQHQQQITKLNHIKQSCLSMMFV